MTSNVRKGPWVTPVVQERSASSTRGGPFRRSPDGTLLITRDVWVSLKGKRNDGYTRTITERAPVESKPLTNKERLETKGRPVNPKRITMALDSSGLYGPDVDEALGVSEPTVDGWEAGWIVPTDEQVGRLATLTGFMAKFFYEDDPAEIGPGFMCGGDEGCVPFGFEAWDEKPCVSFP